jgi:hypothetical protein
MRVNLVPDAPWNLTESAGVLQSMWFIAFASLNIIDLNPD